MAVSAQPVISARMRAERVLAQRRDQPERRRRRRRCSERPQVRGAQVVEVAVERRRPRRARRARSVRRPHRSATSRYQRGVASARTRRARASSSWSRPNSRSGLEHPVARHVRVDELHHRLVDEVGEQHATTSRRARLVAGAHASPTASSPKPPANTQSRANSSLLVGVEQVVGPRHEVVERAVPFDHRRSGRRRAGRGGGSSRSASAAGLITRMRAAASSMASGSPSTPPHDLGDRAGVRRRSRVEARSARRRRPLDEEAHGRAPRRSVAEVGRRRATASGSTRQTCSPGRPSTSRLVARTVTSGHEPSRRSASGRDGARRCSQLSSTSSALPARRYSTSVSSTDRCWRCCTSTAVAIAATVERRVVHGRQLDHEHLAVELVPEVVGERAAPSRVLPTPPGPVRVSRRCVAQPGRRAARARRVAADQRRGLGRQAPRRGAARRRRSRCEQRRVVGEHPRLELAERRRRGRARARRA